MVAFMHTGTRLTAGYRYTTLRDATFLAQLSHTQMKVLRVKDLTKQEMIFLRTQAKLISQKLD